MHRTFVNSLGRMNCMLPLGLQFFAEPNNGSGSGDGNASGAAGSAGTDDPKTPPEGSEKNTSPFDDFLKDKANQAEFDRRVSKALETQKTTMQSEIQSQIENAKTEAQKMAKMNAEEKEKYEREKRESEIAKREADITKRELMATAKEQLADSGVPTSLAEVLNYADAESCKRSIDAVKKSFQEAVEKAVEERLQGGKPPKRADGAIKYTPDQLAKMSPDEINKNWDAIQASLKSH